MREHTNINETKTKGKKNSAYNKPGNDKGHCRSLYHSKKDVKKENGCQKAVDLFKYAVHTKFPQRVIQILYTFRHKIGYK
jgi:hypothetical protein